MKSGLAVRRKVMLLLERARENKLVHFFGFYFSSHSPVFRQLRNSLEAGIDLLLPSQGDTTWRELDVLRRDRTLFFAFVPNVTIETAPSSYHPKNAVRGLRYQGLR